jgi:hypothetical protein
MNARDGSVDMHASDASLHDAGNSVDMHASDASLHDAGNSVDMHASDASLHDAGNNGASIERMLSTDDLSQYDFGMLLSSQDHPGNQAGSSGPQQPVDCPEEVDNGEGHILSVFSRSLLHKFGDMKCRSAVLFFYAGRFGDPAQFMQTAFQTIERNRCVHGSFGFAVKTASYFMMDGALCLVLSAMFGLPFKKWYHVFVGLDAQEIKIVTLKLARPGFVKSCYVNIAAVFNRYTSVDELTRNQGRNPDAVSDCFMHFT